VKVACDAKVRILLNPAPAPQGPLPRELLSKVFVLTPNEAEFKALTGLQAHEDDDWAAARRLASEGPGAVVITLGSRGAVLATRDKAVHVPPYKVKPVDTVGAGDAFNGALATALAEGRSLEEAARFASAAGALATLKLGAQPSMPWRDEIEKLLRSE
jgi:ribokinase